MTNLTYFIKGLGTDYTNLDWSWSWSLARLLQFRSKAIWQDAVRLLAFDAACYTSIP
jgi:hypothetical protein